MAYNSDGYIMLDFAEVDFKKTNQTIEGMFDRCQKVIGTNKFVLVINANNKTPLPSAVSFTNGQYVIESGVYTFSIASNDNIHITKHSNVDDIIDDDHVSTSTTYSSSKITSSINAAISDLTFIEKTGTLNAGSTSIEFEDEGITTDSWIIPFTSVYGVSPTNITTINGKCTLTFESQDNDITVGVRVY